MNNNRNKKLLGNTLIFAISNFSSKVLVFLLLPLYTAVLTTEEYGTADLIISFTALSLPFLTLCIAEAALRFALDSNYSQRDVFTQSFIVVTIGIVVLCLLFPLLSRLDFISDNVILVYLISIPNYYYNLFTKYTRAIGYVKKVGFAGVISTFVLVSTNLIALLVLKIGLLGYLLAYGLAYFVSALYLFFSAKLYSDFSLRQGSLIDKTLLCSMLRYCVPMVPNQICWWLNDTANKYILNGVIDTSAVGLYSAASRIPAILNTVQGFFSDAWILSAIEESNADDKKDFYINYHNYYCATLFALCSFLIVCNKLIALILFSDVFSEAQLYVPGLLISSAFGGMVGFIGAFFNAYKKTSYLFSSTVIGASSSVLFNFILVPQIGIFGAVIANILSYVLIWGIRVYETKVKLGINIRIYRVIVCSIILGIQSLSMVQVSNLLGLYTIQVIAFFSVLFTWRVEIKVFVNYGKQFLKKFFRLN